jgi:HD superfamily phosphohydrolase YqeK
MNQSHRIHHTRLMREKRVASCEQVGHCSIDWARCMSADCRKLVAAALDAGAL